MNTIADFIIDQFMDVIFFREDTAQTIFMFIYPACQVVGHACIQNGIVDIGHNVNAIFSANYHTKYSISCRCEDALALRPKQSLLMQGDCFAAKVQERWLATTYSDFEMC